MDTKNDNNKLHTSYIISELHKYVDSGVCDTWIVSAAYWRLTELAPIPAQMVTTELERDRYLADLKTIESLIEERTADALAIAKESLKRGAVMRKRGKHHG